MTAILGGGIAGLSAAFYALENPRLGALTLYEASDRLGGWIRSKRSPTGAMFEKGPRTMRSTGIGGKNTLRIIEELNLTDRVISIGPNHPAAKKRLIYADKSLHVLPNSFMDLLKIRAPLKRPLILSLWNELKAPRVEKDDEDLYSFVERRLGKDVAEYLISPMVCGIAAGDAKKLSVNFLMRSMFEAEQKHGSILKGTLKTNRMQGDIEKKRLEDMKNTTLGRTTKGPSKLALRAEKEKWAVWTLEGGLEQFPIAMAEHVGGKVDVQFKKCSNLTFAPGKVDVEVDGKVQKFDKVISSLPAKNLAPMVRQQHPELADELEAIPSVTVAVINFEFEENILPCEAFGFLVPPNQNLPLLGVIFDSCVYPQKSTVVTAMMGGAWFDHHFGSNPTEDNLLSIALEQLRITLNVKVNPVNVDVEILKDCIPQQIVGHDARMKRIREYITDHGMALAICGSSYQGVGVNDVILSSKNAIDDMLLRDINA
ncbi:protoporphyrinogen oxidase [Microplitis mediator]|uniref:protoporphyrinogen oxidase n=1 Tax=Microplitis mediator TaxID=375433 RepID=UPI002557A18B|nr:protoporphyrinogen oxidase [Microplitis mediator]